MLLLKKIILGLFISSFIGYLEWGNQKTILGIIEYQLLFEKSFAQETFLHPFVIIPLMGQIALLFMFFAEHPRFWSVLLAASGVGLLFLMLLLVGIISTNFKIIISTLPYLSFLAYFILKRKKLYQLTA
jgi:hypothetical protein